MTNSSQSIEISDDSGLLSVVDTAAYRPFLSEDWTYDQLLAHFSKGMAQKSILVWECGDGGAPYSIEIRRAIDDEPGFRAVTGGILATGTHLHILSYDDLTMAAQFDDESLPSKHNATAVIEVEPGSYKIRVVQRFDPARTSETPAPDFIIEIEKGEGPVWPAVAWLSG